MKKRAVNLVILTTLLMGGQAVDIFPVLTTVVAEAAVNKLAVVSAASVDVKIQPNLKSRTVFTIRKGNRVTILGNAVNGFYRISYNGRTGYVRTSTVVVETPKPVKSTADKVIEEAAKHVGVPYKSGGTTTSGFDCSGYTQYVFNKCGITIGRTTKDQVKNGTAVSSVSSLKKGDLILFKDTYDGCSNPSHVGIYAGNNEFYHASSSKGVIKVSINSTARKINGVNKTWKDLFYQGRRVIK